MKVKFLVISLVVSLAVNVFSPFGWAIDINDASIMAYYGFEEGKGDTAKDTSKNGNNGKINGNPEWTKGKLGSAIFFDGKDDFVEVPQSPSFGLEKLSVLFWMHPESVGGNNPPGKGTSTLVVSNSIRGLGLDWGFEWWNNGSLVWAFWVANGSAVASVNQVGMWYHIAGTYDSGQAKLYIDGELKASNNIGVEKNPGPRPLSIASSLCPAGWGCDGGYFKGSIDEVGVFNKALSEKEIKQVMDGELSGHGAAVFPQGFLASTWGNIKW